MTLNPTTLPVILTTSKGSEEIAVEALQKGAASYVPKRDMHKTLAQVVRQVMSVRDSISADTNHRPNVTYDVNPTRLYSAKQPSGTNKSIQ